MKNWTLYFILIFLTHSLFGGNMLDDKQKAANTANDICPIKIGEQIPDVTLKNSDYEMINLLNLILGKRSILIFYRGGWCPYCNLHLADLVKIDNKLINLGYQIIAISIDKPDKIKESLAKYKPNASKAFGLAFKVDDTNIELLKSHNMNIEEASGEKHNILPVPAVFMLNKEGIIQFEYVNPNYKVRLKSEIILKVAEEYSLE